MDSQERALLEEIVENLDDDTPRLIYADWLEERGNPRAEFIRVQCELEQPVDDSLQQPLRLREKQLLSLYEMQWTEGLDRDHVKYLRFRRGFIESIQTTAPYFRKVIAPRYHNWPIQTLHFLAGPGDLQPLKNVSALSSIRTLKFSGSKLGFKGLRQVLSFQHLNLLRELYLTSCELDSASMSLLADSPLLSGLRNLMLGGNEIRDAGASALAESLRLTSLEQLGVVGCRIEDAGAAALTYSANLPKLQTLRFAGNRVDAQTLTRMVARFGAGLLLL